MAITSSFHPDAQTHIEPVRYGRGSNAMGLLQSVLVDGGPRRGRCAGWRTMAAHPLTYLRAALGARLVAADGHRAGHAVARQLADHAVAAWPAAAGCHHQGHGAPNPTWIPAGNEAVRLLAEEIGGMPGGSVTEAFDIPVTAHILGGAAIGDVARDRRRSTRTTGCTGTRACTSSTARRSSANLGVNPSLTITAQAERAMSIWPNRGEPDPRPPLGHAVPAARADRPGPARRARGRTGGAASLTGVTVPAMPARILVAEDDALVAASVRRALEYEGFAVTVVGDGPARAGDGRRRAARPRRARRDAARARRLRGVPARCGRPAASRWC